MAQKVAKIAQGLVVGLTNAAKQTPALAKETLTKTQGKISSSQSGLIFLQEIVNQPSVQKFWANAKVELAFPGPSEWPAVSKGFSKVLKSAQTGAFVNLTVREAAKNVIVAVEIATFFYVGEIIGRQSLIGYNV